MHTCMRLGKQQLVFISELLGWLGCEIFPQNFQSLPSSFVSPAPQYYYPRINTREQVSSAPACMHRFSLLIESLIVIELLWAAWEVDTTAMQGSIDHSRHYRKNCWDAHACTEHACMHIIRSRVNYSLCTHSLKYWMLTGSEKLISHLEKQACIPLAV